MTKTFTGDHPWPMANGILNHHTRDNVFPHVLEPLAKCDVRKLTELCEAIRAFETVEATAVADVVSGWILHTQLPLGAVQTGRYKAGTAQDDWQDQHGHKGCGGGCDCGK